MIDRARRSREAWLAAAFFLAFTVLMTWPQALRLADGAADLWDAKLSAWILHWDYVQTLRDPLNLFQAPILQPSRYALAFSENMYGAAVFGFPFLAGGASLLLNYNLVLLLGMFLSALTAWALARYVTGDPLASLVAGVVYGFLPYKLSQLAHLHMQWGPFLCLVFLFLLKYLDGGRRRDAVLLGVFFAWDLLACLQYAFFTGFLVAVVLALEAAGGGPHRRRRIAGAVVALAAATLACAPFLIPYARASALYGMRRSFGEMKFFSALPGHFLSAGDRNKFWGPLTTRWRGYEGDFFPGLTPLALAGIALARLRPTAVARSASRASSGRRRAARIVDILLLLIGGVWIASLVRPNLRIGPLSVGDAGRVQVFLTLAVIARLALAFPGSRFADLGDFLRRMRLDRRAFLLLVLAAAGVVVALGAHTPYYRFLFQSFGPLFRSIRVSARGVVIFQVALAVLAAWGLALWIRGLGRGARLAAVAAVLAVLTLEYRAFPIEILDDDASPRPEYEWARSVDFQGNLLEWPFGFPHDCEYTFRQAEHDKPLVNGHSSFSPTPYGELYGQMHLRPIPESVWNALPSFEASLILYHAGDASAIEAASYRGFVRRGLASGRLELLGSFGGRRDRVFAFRRVGAPAFETHLSDTARARARRELEEFMAISDSAIGPPFGVIQVPAEGENVAGGSWGFGWALDDSGIAQIRIGTELGPASLAQLGGKWPGLAEAFPDLSDAPHGGYGFAVPDVPPGPHTLFVTLEGKDGGVTVLTRPIRVAAKPEPAGAPTPRGPGS